MQLGDKVKYIRYTKDRQLQEGEGVIRAICLDLNKRIQIQVADCENVFNTPEKCINPTEEFKKKFTDLCALTDELADEGNNKVKELATEYSNRIEKLYDEVLGMPIEV